MYFSTALIATAVSIAPLAHAAQGSPFHYAGEFGGAAGKGLGFTTTLKDGKPYYLTVFDDLVLSPKAPSYGQWWFKKTNPRASFDTLWYSTDNRVATFVPSHQQFETRRVEQLAVGHFNLTPRTPTSPELLKFQDSTDFITCDVAGLEGKKFGFTKKLSIASIGTPSWAKHGSCEQITLKCIGC